MAVQNALRVWRGIVVYAFGASCVYKCEALTECFDTAAAGKLRATFLFVDAGNGNLKLAVCVLKHILLCAQRLKFGIGLLVLEHPHIVTLAMRVGGVCPALGAGADALAVVVCPVHFTQIFTTVCVYVYAIMTA